MSNAKDNNNKQKREKGEKRRKIKCSNSLTGTRRKPKRISKKSCPSSSSSVVSTPAYDNVCGTSSQVMNPVSCEQQSSDTSVLPSVPESHRRTRSPPPSTSKKFPKATIEQVPSSSLITTRSMMSLSKDCSRKRSRSTASTSCTSVRRKK